MHEATFQNRTSSAPDQAAEGQMAPASRLMRVLLTCGLIAGPFYLVVGLIQALARPGFDLLHDGLSLLANGELGWIQVTNLVLTGVLVWQPG